MRRADLKGSKIIEDLVWSSVVTSQTMSKLRREDLPTERPQRTPGTKETRSSCESSAANAIEH